MNLAALLRVFTRDLYEFDLYDLFLERISRTNRGIPVQNISGIYCIIYYEQSLIFKIVDTLPVINSDL